MSGRGRGSDETAKIVVPQPDADWGTVWQFALTYNAYDRHGGFDGAAEIGNAVAGAWRTGRQLPDDLGIARAALFFEQRRYRHFDHPPSGEAETYVRKLVARISDLSGGELPGPPDPLP